MEAGPSGSPADADQPPTELARPVDATEASLAWSIDQSPELVAYRPRWIARTAVAGALVLVAAAGGVAVWQVRGSDPEPVASAPTTSTVTIEPAAANTVPPRAPEVVPPPLPPTRSQPPAPPAPVALPAQAGSVFVGTQSRRTFCQVTAGSVTCLVDFVVNTPIRYGAPANGVRVSTLGDFEWTIGDAGEQPVNTLSYGVLYRALGWTITPTSEGTTFINDTTGHGMTVSVEGVQPF